MNNKFSNTKPTKGRGSSGGGAGGAVLDANDPLTQYYLQISDEANAQQAVDKKRAENTPYVHNMHMVSSGDSSNNLKPFDWNNYVDVEEEDDVEQVRAQASDSSNAAESISIYEEQTGDFVHVHLEHLGVGKGGGSQEGGEVDGEQLSQSQNQSSKKSKKKNSKFSFYRKFASQGVGGVIQSALSSSSFGVGQKQPAPVVEDPPSCLEKQRTDPEPLQRVQAIEGSPIPVQPSLPSMPTETGESDSEYIAANSPTVSVKSQNQQGVVTFDHQARPGKNPPPSIRTRTNDILTNMYSKSLTTDIGTSRSLEDEEDSDAYHLHNQWHNKMQARQQHLKAQARMALEGKAAAAGQEGEPFQMTLWQTMQHNTRANFCAVFLLGVALCCLILLVVARYTNTTELLFYDEESDSEIVVSNNERLLTIELLALGLILVLLLGSALYCGVATCDSNRALIQHVKHEDACLANSGPRRKHPPPQTGLYGAPTFSSVGSRYNDRDLLSSMEEGSRHRTPYINTNNNGAPMATDYQEMNDSACCSPLAWNNSIPENPSYISPTYTATEDDDDADYEESRRSRPRKRKEKQQAAMMMPPQPQYSTTNDEQDPTETEQQSSSEDEDPSSYHEDSSSSEDESSDEDSESDASSLQPRSSRRRRRRRSISRERRSSKTSNNKKSSSKKSSSKKSSSRERSSAVRTPKRRSSRSKRAPTKSSSRRQK